MGFIVNGIDGTSIIKRFWAKKDKRSNNTSTKGEKLKAIYEETERIKDKEYDLGTEALTDDEKEILRLIEKSKNDPCPVDPNLRDICLRTRKRTSNIYYVSVGIFIFASFFTYVLPEYL